MKKLLLTMLAVALLVSFAGAAYLIAPRQVKERIGVATGSPETSVRANGAASRTPEDLKVLFHETRIANQPNDAQAHRLLAHALVARAEATGDSADYDRSWAELDQAEQLESRSLITILFKAKLLLSRHRFAQARDVAGQGLQKDADDVALIGLSSDTAVAMGDFKAAEAHLQRLLVLAPDSPDTWSKMSYLAEMRGNLDEATALMDKALAAGYEKDVKYESLAWLHTILGELEARRGKLDVAREHYTAALKKAPDYRLAVEFTADLDMWQGNQKASEEGYRHLLSRRFDPKIQLRLADLLERQGNKDEAARLRDESLQFFERVVSGGNEGYLRDLARLDLAAGRYQRAAELAARDLTLRLTVESRALYNRILQSAAEAGHPLPNYAPLAPRSNTPTTAQSTPVAVLSR